MNTSKKILMIADDFGMTNTRDEAILKGLDEGILTGACIVPNGNTFDDAMLKFSKLKKGDLGIHLDLIEGSSISDVKKLTYENGNFKNGYISLLLKSFDFDFLSDVEKELRAQTQKAIKKGDELGIKFTFINSHIHFHSIPNIFKIVKKISKEYGIKYIRCQKEIPDRLDKIKPINLVKVGVLWVCNLFNSSDFTNDYIIGVAHTSDMTSKNILSSLNVLKNKKGIIEILLHPDTNPENKSGYKEFQTVMNKNLKDETENMGFIFSNISDI